LGGGSRGTYLSNITKQAIEKKYIVRNMVFMMFKNRMMGI